MLPGISFKKLKNDFLIEKLSCGIKMNLELVRRQKSHTPRL